MKTHDRSSAGWPIINRPAGFNPAPLTLLAAAIILLLAPSAAVACRCKEPTEIAGSYKRSVAVVRAKVSNVTPNPKIDGLTVILQVSDVWKTSLPQMITVQTGTDCRFPFEEGGEYLVVLLKMQDGYTTGRCLGNRPIQEAKGAMEWLNSKGVRGRVQ